MDKLRHFSRAHLLLFGIVALAAFFRLYRIDEIPPGFQFDQAYYVFDSLRLLQGQFHVFFPTPGGTEPLFPYLAMVGIAIFGVVPLGLKLTSAVVGILSIPLAFGLGRSLFQSTRIGLMTAFFMAISIWHIFYGRYGERIQLLVLLAIPMFWFFWRAIDKRDMRAYVLTGLFLGLGLDTNLAARMLPFALLLVTAYMILTDREHASAYLKGLLCIAGVAALLFLPLAIYFVSYPDQLFSHALQVSVFTPHGSESGDVVASVMHNAARLLEMFFVRGDEGMIRNVPNRPIFDPFIAVIFVVGVLAWASSLFSRRATPLSHRRAVFLLAWMVTGFLTSLISDDAPNFSRLHPIIPVVMLLPAWGASEIWDHLHGLAFQRVGVAAFAVVVLASTGLSYRDYFVTFGEDPGTYFAFNADRVELANWVNQNAHTEHLFLAPVARDIATVSLLTRETPLKSFESRDTIVLPSRADHMDALYVFPPEQEGKARTLKSRLGAIATLDQARTSSGAPLLFDVRIPSRNLPEVADPLKALVAGSEYLKPLQRSQASWVNGMRLLGYTISPEGPGGRNVTVTLFLQGTRLMHEDYTFSLKVRDGRGRVWGQEDKWAGTNSYATTQWGVGDVVIEKFYPGLSACAPAGAYDVTVEAYNPKNMEVLRQGDGSPEVIALGGFNAGPSQGNLYGHLEPETLADLNIAKDLDLFGLTLSSSALKANESFSLALFWHGTNRTNRLNKVSIQLVDSAGQTFPVGESSFALPPDGQGVCILLDMTVPPNIARGAGELFLDDKKITSVYVER